jgi:GNAT superfamily N-acetyltransferase
MVSFEVGRPGPQPGLVEELLRDLPEWFGIESAVADYVDAARRLPTLVAYAPNGQSIGALLLERHFPETAEIHLMVVRRSWHGQGAGSALVAAAEASLREDGAEILSVKTLGPSNPDAGYRLTRQFYLGRGFIPVEELPDLWPGNPCLIMVKPLHTA